MHIQKTVLILALAALIPLARAETYSLGVFDLAGLPPATLPPCGSLLDLDSPDTYADDTAVEVRQDGNPLGYIPARFQAQIREMQRRGVQIQLRVQRLHLTPGAGRFLEVELRATTADVLLLIPLVEAVEEDLESEEW